MKRRDLPTRARQLEPIVRQLPGVRGRGLMLGWPVRGAAQRCAPLLRRGILALPEGEADDVIAITPPLTISVRQLRYAIEICGECSR
jgi:acetylornithine/succinyldiaminopimelate/putrescine aminotransferase